MCCCRIVGDSDFSVLCSNCLSNLGCEDDCKVGGAEVGRGGTGEECVLGVEGL